MLVGQSFSAHGVLLVCVFYRLCIRAMLTRLHLLKHVLQSMQPLQLLLSWPNKAMECWDISAPPRVEFSDLLLPLKHLYPFIIKHLDAATITSDAIAIRGQITTAEDH